MRVRDSVITWVVVFSVFAVWDSAGAQELDLGLRQTRGELPHDHDFALNITGPAWRRIDQRADNEVDPIRLDRSHSGLVGFSLVACPASGMRSPP